MLECVVNVSEGRDQLVLRRLALAAGPELLDLHSDPDHHRSVLTLAGPDVEQAVRRLATACIDELTLVGHGGVHPRIGVLDVVPFVALPAAVAGAVGPVTATVHGSPDPDPIATAARDAFATWAGATLALPCFLYGPERTLPDVRRAAFTTLVPDAGPTSPHPTAGACAVGVRPPMVAWNVWLEPSAGIETARAVARRLRGPAVRALGLDLAGHPQVSCNLIDPLVVGPGAVLDAVRTMAPVARCELVGLVPAAVLAAEPAARWGELDLGRTKTIEARLGEAGLDGGRF